MTLTLTTNDPAGDCPAATSTVVITINPPATANAGSAQAVCVGGTVTLAGTIGGSATTSTWSAPSGTFSDATSLTSTYTPSITSGTVTLTLTTNDPAGDCPAATSTVVITMNPLPDFTLTKPAACPGSSEDVNITALTNAVPATSQLKIDAGAYAAYPSPATVTGLSVGSHTLTVKNANGCETAKNVTISSIVPVVCLPVTVVRKVGNN